MEYRRGGRRVSATSCDLAPLITAVWNIRDGVNRAPDDPPLRGARLSRPERSRRAGTLGRQRGM